MKVVLATHFPLDPESPRGGVEAVSVNLALALAALKQLEIHVVAFERGFSEPRSDSWGEIMVHRLPRPPGSTLWRALGPERRRLWAYLRELRPDLVHAHDTYGVMVRGLPLPRVLTIHGFIYGDTLYARAPFSRLRSLLWRRVETAAWADQPHIISISPYVRERLRGITRGVIHDVENPIAEKFFRLEKEEQNGVVFSAAAICPRKNTLALVDAVAQVVPHCPEVQLRLAGPVTDAAYGDLVIARIKEHALQDRVTLLGQIDSDRVAQELAQAGAFCLMSLEENSPMGIGEAMASGIPVLSSNRCGMPYMIRQGETGFLMEPHDRTTLARRLIQTLRDERLRREMGARAQAFARDRYYPTGVASRTLQVYEQVMGSDLEIH